MDHFHGYSENALDFQTMYPCQLNLKIKNSWKRARTGVEDVAIKAAGLKLSCEGDAKR